MNGRVYLRSWVLAVFVTGVILASAIEAEARESAASLAGRPYTEPVVPTIFLHFIRGRGHLANSPQREQLCRYLGKELVSRMSGRYVDTRLLDSRKGFSPAVGHICLVAEVTDYKLGFKGASIITIDCRAVTRPGGEPIFYKAYSRATGRGWTRLCKVIAKDIAADMQRVVRELDPDMWSGIEDAPSPPRNGEGQQKGTPAERLGQLKQMLDRGLITHAEYDSTKKRILSEL